MLKNCLNFLKLNKQKNKIFGHTKKNMYSIKTLPDNKIPEIKENSNKLEENEENETNTNSIPGKFPYMPIFDHPLIPGFSRILSVNQTIIEKLKILNVEKTKIVLSVLKNPEKLEGIQIQK